MWAVLILIPFPIVLLVYWSVTLLRVLDGVRHLPTARDGAEAAEREPPGDRVCVVVAAHNEARCIGPLIRSLRAQTHGSLRVVLALDRCTDDTAAVAREAIGDDERFEILEIDDCPSSWAGKVHALWTAVRRSAHAQEADALLFADADTVFEPALISGTLRLLRDRELGMLSLWSTLSVDRWFEHIVQPACGLELMYQFPLPKANRDENRRAFANGQYILFDREAYERLGGHEAVRDELLEDMALARRAAREGVRAGAFLADGMLMVRMYEGWREFERGWRRIFMDCAGRKVSRLRRASRRIRMVHTALPTVTVLTLVLSLSLAVFGNGGWAAWLTAGISLAAVALWLGMLAALYRIGSVPVWTAPLHPIGAWMTGGILREAALDLEQSRPIRWGGREYTPKRRD